MKKFNFDNTILVTLLTATGYYMTELFYAAQLDYYGIPTTTLSIGPEKICRAVSKLWIFIFLLLLSYRFYSFRSKPVEKEDSGYGRATENRNFRRNVDNMFFGFSVFIFVLYCGSVLSREFALFSAVLSMMLVEILVLLFKKNERFRNRILTPKFIRHSAKNDWSSLLSNAFFCWCGFQIASIQGVKTVNEKEVFLRLRAEPEWILASNNSDKAILAKFDPSSFSLTGDLRIIELQNAEFFPERIGTLTPAEPHKRKSLKEAKNSGDSRKSPPTSKAPTP